MKLFLINTLDGLDAALCIILKFTNLETAEP